MRKLAVCLLAVPLLLGGASEAGQVSLPEQSVSEYQSSFYGGVEVFPFEEGVALADLIVEVEIIEKQDDGLSHPTPKSIFEAHIVSTQKQDHGLESDVIHVMQQGNDRMLFNDNPLFEQGDRYILFLKKAVGPSSEHYPNLYWIQGEESNMYKDLGNETVEKMGFVDVSMSELQPAPGERAATTQILDKQRFIERIQLISGDAPVDFASDLTGVTEQMPIKCGEPVQDPLPDH
ncbi:hypothetical protein [Paenibacillus daejeonensis]|uniref:hypothetical protein n=1 Tax=Paenibacillus daejeonensis TaxID=135193 RepID=UPI00037AE116|nr:hypothetical protein [Paenibacillus daejeonensis]